MNRIQIDINQPERGYFTCKLKTGKGVYANPLYTDDINAVVSWLADHGIKEQIPAPAEEEGTSTMGGNTV